MFETRLIIDSWNEFTKLTLKTKPFFPLLSLVKKRMEYFQAYFCKRFQRSFKILTKKSNNIMLNNSTSSSKHVLFHSLGLFRAQSFFFHSQHTKNKFSLKLFQYKKNRSFSELQYSDWVYFVNFCFPFACSRKFHFVFLPQTILFFSWCREILLKLRSFITLHSSTHSLRGWEFNRNLETLYIKRLAYSISKMENTLVVFRKFQ